MNYLEALSNAISAMKAADLSMDTAGTSTPSFLELAHGWLEIAREIRQSMEGGMTMEQADHHMVDSLPVQE